MEMLLTDCQFERNEKTLLTPDTGPADGQRNSSHALGTFRLD